MKNSIFISIVMIIVSFYGYADYFPPKNSSKDTSAILLKEVVVHSGASIDKNILSSETPEKISSIGGGPLANWLGIHVDNPILFYKELKSFSLFITDRVENDNTFLIDFYSMGENNLPDKKINSTPFEFNLYKKGWNEFEIPSKIEVPLNGIILVFKYKKRSVNWQKQVNSIGLGTYFTNKKTYIFRENEWKFFPIYEMFQEKYSDRVSLMIKISAYR